MSVRFGRKLMILRTDNGWEYVTTELTNFLKKERIHQLTVSYILQQNGVVERKNHYLESEKCMLLDAGLDNHSWGEAVLTAKYLQNRMVSRSVDKTPVEFLQFNLSLQMRVSFILFFIIFHIDFIYLFVTFYF